MITFKCEHADGNSVTHTTHAEFIGDVINDFRYFLKGMGFHENNVDEYLLDPEILGIYPEDLSKLVKKAQKSAGK